MRWASSSGCDNCGFAADLYHFDATEGGNPFDQGALCDECNTLAVKVDDAIAVQRERADRHWTNLDNATALVERLHDWHAGRVTAAMGTDLEKRDEAWLVNLAAHMRDGHDLRIVADTLEGKR